MPTNTRLSLSLLVLSLFMLPNAYSQSTIDNPSVEVSVTQAERLGTTPPLRDLLRPATTSYSSKREESKRGKRVPPNFYNESREPRVEAPYAQPKGEDPVRQTTPWFGPGLVVEPTVNVDGLQFPGPPDPTGDAGPDHYVQAVNSFTGSALQIFDKEGNILGDFDPNTIWTQVNSTGAGDPIIIYDQEVGRWLITEFTAPGVNTFLIGISADSDPFSEYTVYSFSAPNFPDYPKYGVWKDTYSIASNEQGGQTWVNYFIDKTALLAGESTVDIQRLTLDAPNISGPVINVTSPVDWSGQTPPVSNNPILLSLSDDAWGAVSEDQYFVHTVALDWVTPSNTTVTTQTLLPSAFDTNPCFPTEGQFGECIEQLGGAGFSGITEIIMNQSHYRNFGTHESIVFCFTADVTAGDNQAGIRWTELRRLPGENDWTIHQEGTYGLDDGLDRFVPSIAMDGAGNIGICYSVSSPEMYPEFRFTGRRASDPPGIMTVQEYSLVTGISPLQTFGRFGDYAHMTIDPLDDRTFWMTGEYAGVNGTGATRVAAFRLRRDTIDFTVSQLLSPTSADDLTDMESVSIEIKNVGLDTPSVFQVGYIFENEPAVIEDVSMMLMPDSVYQHTFTPPVNMDAIANYQFKTFVVLPNDQAVFNDTLRRVVSKLPRFDLAVTDIEGIPALLCGDEVTVTVTYTNLGTNTLNSGTLTLTTNGGPGIEFTWEEELLPGESATFTQTISGLLDGNNELVVTTSDPNGVADERPGNDVLTTNFTAFQNGEIITLELLTDDYPQETTWELVDDATGNVVYEGGPYSQAVTLFNEEMCLDPEGCYTFTIFDSYGDGICCGFGLGNYRLVNADGNVVYESTGEFGISESNSFCPSLLCFLEATINTEPAIEGNVEGGSIFIKAGGGTPPFEYSIDGGDNFVDSGIFTDLAPTNYLVIIQDANGCTIEQEVVVDFISSNDDILNGFTFELFPNPNDGVFRINVTNEELDGVHLHFDIFDAEGKHVRVGQLANYNGVYTGMVSLYDYPSGTYFIRFKDQRITRVLRVEKL